MKKHLTKTAAYDIMEFSAAHPRARPAIITPAAAFVNTQIKKIMHKNSGLLLCNPLIFIF